MRLFYNLIQQISLQIYYIQIRVTLNLYLSKLCGLFHSYNSNECELSKSRIYYKVCILLLIEYFY